MALQEIFNQLGAVYGSTTRPPAHRASSSVDYSNVFSGATPAGTPAGEKGAQAFGSVTPYGNAVTGKFGTEVQATADQDMFAQLFNSLGGGLLRQGQGAQVQGLDALPFDLSTLASAFGQDGTTRAMSAGANDFLGLGRNLAGAFNNFDRNAFAAEQKGVLDRIAGPGEARAASTLANQLFSRGRLGGSDTFSGRAFGELAQSQSLANDQRALAALGFADTERNSLANLSSVFSNLGSGLGLQGSQLAGLNLSNIMGGANAIRSDQGFQNQQLQTLLGLGGSSLTGGQQAYAPLQQVLNNAFTTKEGSINEYLARQGVQQNRGSSGAMSFLGSLAGAGVGGWLGNKAGQAAMGAKVGAGVGSSFGDLFG